MRGNSQDHSASEMTGVITDCLMVTIYEEPDVNAEVLAVIPALSEVIVDMDASTTNFYKICNAAGIQGFCGKKYVALRR